MAALTRRWDVVVVGGGPAGLSAALLLGRCTRRVLVLDDQRYRNERARSVNGYLSRDGISPGELRRLGRAELVRYGVQVLHLEVVRAEVVPGGFRLVLADGADLWTRSLVLATGVRDVLPQIPGLQELFGASVHHCPYCDAWEHRDRALGVHGQAGGELALMLRTWSPDVVFFAEGPVVDDRLLYRLSVAGIVIVTEPVSRFAAIDGQLDHVELRSGRIVPRDAIFLKLDGGQRQRSNLAQQLGLTVLPEGGIRHDGQGGTIVPGLFVCGDATRDLLLSIVAASEGVLVGVHVNAFLQDAR